MQQHQTRRSVGGAPVVGGAADVVRARALLQARNEGQEQVALQPVLVQRIRRPGVTAAPNQGAKLSGKWSSGIFGCCMQAKCMCDPPRKHRKELNTAFHHQHAAHQLDLLPLRYSLQGQRCCLNMTRELALCTAAMQVQGC